MHDHDDLIRADGVIEVHDLAGQSWRLEIDEPRDLHLALFVRDACGFSGAASVGPLMEPPLVAALIPAEHRDTTARAWQEWWESLLASRGPVTGPADGAFGAQMSRQVQQRLAVAAPPDFAALAGTPMLQQAAARSWREGYQEWWERPASAEARAANPQVPIAGVRGQLITAIMERSRTHHVQGVVAELEAQLHRKARPFDVTIEVLAAHGDNAIMVGPAHALVPLDLFTDSNRYIPWLHGLLAPLA